MAFINIMSDLGKHKKVSNLLVDWLEERVDGVVQYGVSDLRANQINNFKQEIWLAKLS